MAVAPTETAASPKAFAPARRAVSLTPALAADKGSREADVADRLGLVVCVSERFNNDLLRIKRVIDYRFSEFRRSGVLEMALLEEGNGHL